MDAILHLVDGFDERQCTGNEQPLVFVGELCCSRANHTISQHIHPRFPLTDPADVASITPAAVRSSEFEETAFVAHEALSNREFGTRAREGRQVETLAVGAVLGSEADFR